MSYKLTNDLTPPYTNSFNHVVNYIDNETGKRLGGNCALVFGSVWEFCQMPDKDYPGRNSGMCYATREAIAHDIGFSVQTISRHLKTLCRLGFLRNDNPDLRGKPHVYKITGKYLDIADWNQGGN